MELSHLHMPILYLWMKDDEIRELSNLHAMAIKLLGCIIIQEIIFYYSQHLHHDIHVPQITNG